MKFITFVNLAYTDMCYNLYKQLSVFDRHEDLTVVCTDINTFNKLSQYKMDCQIEVYKPVLFKNVEETLQIYLSNTEYGSTSNLSPSYTMYQFLKHDAFYQMLLKHDHVCLIDSDMIIFEDFVDELFYWIDNQRKFKVIDTPAYLAFKYYLQIKIGVNLEQPESLYRWIGKKQLINGGLMYANNRCYSTLNHIQNYCKLFIPHFGQLNNIDENIVTEYFGRSVLHSMDNTFAITDHINLINNVGVKYTPEQVLKLKPMTFHPTFEADKIQFIKDCNQWFVE